MMRVLLVVAVFGAAAALNVAPTKALGSSKAAVEKTNSTTGMDMTLGPFDDKVAACKYCFTSHTRTLVVSHCTCTAYEDGGAMMFCTGTGAGIKHVQEMGGCKCTEKNMEQVGANVRR